MKPSSEFKILYVIIFHIILTPFSTSAQNFGTPEQREALFDTLVQQTIRRESWSPFKMDATTFANQAEVLRAEFRGADSYLLLFEAVTKLSALREDSHLRVSTEDSFRDTYNFIRYAPLLFYPDFTSEDPSFFVSGIARNITSMTSENIAFGDHVVAIDDKSISAWYAMADQLDGASTKYHQLWEIAEQMDRMLGYFPDELYDQDRTQVTFTLQRADETQYSVTLPYFNARPGINLIQNRTYANYNLRVSYSNFDVYLHNSENIILLSWKDLEQPELTQELEALVENLSGTSIMDTHDVIVDMSQSSGGSGSPLILQLLVNEPFKTTFGNVRISDIADELAEDLGGSVRTWILGAIGASLEYTSNEPFKLRYFSVGQDGVMQPATSPFGKNFKGNKAFIFGSNTGSNVDQFAAMVIDNQLGFSVGMPTGGYSNTWEWEEDYVFPPDSTEEAFEFMWSVGHTIRPNGEVLEGNPAIPDSVILLSRDNFEAYYDDLIMIAEDYLLSKVITSSENPFDKKTDFRVYPNPITSQDIIIDFAQAGDYQIQVIDLQGKLICSFGEKYYQSGQNTLNLPHLTKSSYTLKITQQGKLVHSQLIHKN